MVVDESGLLGRSLLALTVEFERSEKLTAQIRCQIDALNNRYGLSAFAEVTERDDESGTEFVDSGIVGNDEIIA